MDFYRICVKKVKGEELASLYPDFIVGRTQDLMVQGGQFYAVWDEAAGLWSTDEYAVQRLVDKELRSYSEDLQKKTGEMYNVKYLANFANGMWAQFRKYMRNISDNQHDLDANLTFANQNVTKKDYVSQRLPYALEAGDHSAWDELVGTFYAVEERSKIEWYLGSIIAGDSKINDRFLVIYGPPGTGKGTVLTIAGKMFKGYTKTFNAKALGSGGSSFSTQAFKNNPLVGIQYDGDLSKIEDNTILNLIASHEPMEINEKYKPILERALHTALLMGTNKPVKITDAQSGLLRRLLDAYTTGVKIPKRHYDTLMARTSFELGAIAVHCLEVYRKMGKNYYESYRPLQMMFQTDIFFNFIEHYYDVFKGEDGVSLSVAYTMYKEYCSETGIDRMLPQYKFREELKHYFDHFKDRKEVDGKQVRSYFWGFNANKFKVAAKDELSYSLAMDETTSLLDEMLADMPAQYQVWEEERGIFRPQYKWANVKTTLSELDTSQVHYVKVPENLIVIDFDLKDEGGVSALERNMEAASLWPPTYAELSKSGEGVHLHYFTDQDVESLSPVYSDGIEVKTLLGDSALRRRVTRCNNIPVSVLNLRLAEKEVEKVTDAKQMASERSVRNLIARAMTKEFGSTKPSVDFIKKILDDAYESGMVYDVSDLRPKVLAFANNSSNQNLVAIKTVLQMKWASEERDVDAPPVGNNETPTERVERNMMENQGNPLVKKDERLAFYDIEVYPNLFVLCWKWAGSNSVQKMINPSPEECERLLKLNLIGYNCRRYDNHILYARILGRTIEQLFDLSQRIIVHRDHQAMFREAYGLSYVDVYDMASAENKMSQKAWQIKLGLFHKELNLPWDKPVPDDKIMMVVDYCANDVTTLEEVFNHLKGDFSARQILAALSGLAVNDTTQRHAARIIFGNDPRPQQHFIYTDLSKEFPGYTYVPTRMPKSDYRGKDPSEGGFVFDQPGMYEDVWELDIASMHPTSIEQLNLFGKYTPRFSALKQARLAIKHKDYESAGEMLDGKLKPFLGDPADAKALSDALKTAINIVYGLTSARFDNPFKDYRNVDNIVAKRGALFMIELLTVCEEKGLKVVHIKTDSIKIAGATSEDIEEIKMFGEKYGYVFEHEATYEKFCLVNAAVWIAKVGWHENSTKIGKWVAKGAQFAHPYVFKTLFSHEELVFDDYCETKQVTGEGMYLDFREHDPDDEELVFVGRSGRFVPVPDGQGGGFLYRLKDGKYYAVTGTKDYKWIDSEVAKARGDELVVDMSYFEKLQDDALNAIEKYGDFKRFVS